MKRSEINAIIKEFEAMLKEYHFALPPFLSFTPEEWAEKGHEYDEIRDNALGWDITDYGMGDFDKLGLSLITIRNGNTHNPKYTKTYAEKIMYLRPGQVSPNHFHWNKMEDIINRGGGRIIFKLWNATPDEELADTDVEICRDGRRYMVPAGSEIVLEPGESLSLYPYYYHEFVVDPTSGPTLIGEVSMCNDDNTDNRFYKPLGRFPTIEEDEPPYRLLCNEYPPAKD
ncbi:MAG: D-lyxose/D-mannose family sugar isomerase [Lawsonibacter sp.]|nr:D-lyxose/D-mannose family sugar isomerase [Oscillospiraceae bacterium]MCI9353052.1 D-lyxose/D-mannose family sugar isomerase [Lawsonibacter sp.]